MESLFDRMHEEDIANGFDFFKRRTEKEVQELDKQSALQLQVLLEPYAEVRNTMHHPCFKFVWEELMDQYSFELIADQPQAAGAVECSATLPEKMLMLEKAYDQEMHDVLAEYAELMRKECLAPQWQLRVGEVQPGNTIIVVPVAASKRGPVEEECLRNTKRICLDGK